MTAHSYIRLQLVVFALVSTAFTNIYITQPVLPVLQIEFAADILLVSLSVSAVIFGIAISILPWGYLADRAPIKPIIICGGICIAACGLICALTTDLWILIGTRCLQGIFIPCLTTCLAAHLAKTLPADRLEIVMGSYVAATVLGGLFSRLLGGWIHPPLHWRYAFVSASLLTIGATLCAIWLLPRTAGKTAHQDQKIDLLHLVARRDLLRIYLCGAGSFAIFSTIFNYLPFRLSAQPFGFSTELTTLFYLAYVVGIFVAPVAGRFSSRHGSGNALAAGSAVLVTALALLLLPSIAAVILGVLGSCAGFFTIQSAAVGALNRKLSSGQGRANALYVLFYYLGGWLGITGSGIVYKQSGWNALIYICMLLVVIPLSSAIGERNAKKSQ